VTLINADDRAYLTIEEPQRYAIGPPTAPLLILNGVDAHGCMWVADEPPEWAGPTAVTPMDRRQSGHGGYAGEPTFDPLTLTLTGTVTAPTPAGLRAAHRRLLEAWAGAAPAFTRYTHLDDDPAKGLWVLPLGTPKWTSHDTRAADFSVQFVAEDPIKTGDAASYGPVRLPTPGAAGGYPVTGPMPWTAVGGSVQFTVATVPNAGDQDSHAVYTVTGPIPQPVIVLGTGARVQLAADLNPGDTWVVDTAAGTSTVNGVNRYDAWGPDSTFPLIPPGGTELRLRSATGGTDQSAGVTALTAPSWS
jgi:hypothetical protein